MVSRRIECERDRLRLSLEDRLSDADQAELADHLETCDACRRELEQMAAASRYWGDAGLLRGERSPDASPTGILPREGDGRDNVDAAWLGFLDPPDPDHPGMLGRLGTYEILGVLGQGGMGVVLKAHDPVLDRTVAIKVLAPPLAHAATARRRFAREARAVAAVGHENIVTIYAVDEFRGLPYLVMQYVPGRSLQEKLDESGPLEIRDILRIGTQAARALAAAHAQGVVHRYIKPANILLENCVERVKITDFGLARAVDDASLTQSGLIAGTPQYMAPEQARGEPVDARADLFALGAVLYATAAGRSPFRADSAMAVLKRVCDDHHRPLRELNPDVPAWLELIIDGLLAKQTADRLQSAAEVADLLEKGLAHLQQPTILPPPVVPRTARSQAPRREPAPRPAAPRTLRRLPMAAALVLLAAAGLGASEAAGLTQVSAFVATVFRIKTTDGTLIVKVDDPDVKVQIDGDTVVIGGAGTQEIRLKAGSHRVRATKDGKPVREELVTIARGGKEIVNIGFEPALSAPGPVSMPSNRSGPIVPPAPLPLTRQVQAVAAPRKKDTNPRIRSRNVQLTTAIDPAEAKPGDTITLSVTAKLDPGYHIYKYVPNAPPAASGPVYTTFDLFDTDGLEPRGDWSASREPIRRKEASFPELAFVEYYEDEVTWSIRLKAPPTAAAGKKSIRVQAGYMVCNDRFCSPPGRWTLPSAALTVSGRDRGDGPVGGGTTGRGEAARARAMVWGLAFSPDGSHLAMAQQAIDRPDSVLRVRDLRRGSEQVWLHDNAGYRSVAFSSDGRTLAAGVFDGTLTFLEQSGEWNVHHNENQGAAINAVAFIPGTTTLAVGDWDGWVRFHGPDPLANRQPLRYPGRIWSLAVSPDAKSLAVGGEANTVQVFDLATRQLKATLEGHDHAVESLAFSPEGQLLVSAGGRLVRFWETATWKESGAPISHSPEVICVRFSPDGKLLAISDGESFLPHYNVLSTSVMLWDVAARAEIRRLWGHTNTIWALAFSPDGKTLASGSADQTIRLWDPATGRLPETIVPGESVGRTGAHAGSADDTKAIRRDTEAR